MLCVEYARWGQTPADLRDLTMNAPHPRTRKRFLGFCQLSGQVVQVPDCWLPEAVSGGGDQVPQRGHALHVDGPAAGERDGLVDVAGRTQEVADLIEGPAEAMSRIEVLEAAHRPVASFGSCRIPGWSLMGPGWP
jgi:hypothetical protein